MASKDEEALQEDLYRKMLVPPGKKIDLKRDYDPGFTVKMTKDKAAATLLKGITQLAEFQDKLYAQDRYSLLVVFQALDAAGKDGTIKHVMSGLNPQGCEVHSFKAPSAEELNHDYMWRCVKALPERGRIGEKNWKFSASDTLERAFWKDYMAAYEDMFHHTSTKWAPWIIVPADNKRFTRLAVAHGIYRTLKGLHLRYPTISDERRAQLQKARDMLDKE